MHATDAPPHTDATRELSETWLDSLARINKPRFFAHLADRAGVELDRALFPLLLRIGLEERIGVTDLAGHVGSDHSTVSRQLTRLEERNLIAREPSARDQRIKEAVLTPAGKRMLDKLNGARQDLLAEALADWTEDEKHQLSALVRKLSESMRAYAADVDGR